MDGNGTLCNLKVEKHNYKKDRTVCKSCYSEKKINTNFHYQRPKIAPKKDFQRFVEMFPRNNNNQSLIIRFSNCGKSYLLNYIPFQKQEPIYLFSESINRYSIIKDHTSEEIQPLKNYENSGAVFDDMLGTKQAKGIDKSFTRDRH